MRSTVKMRLHPVGGTDPKETILCSGPSSWPPVWYLHGDLTRIGIDEPIPYRLTSQGLYTPWSSMDDLSEMDGLFDD
jgi:hypothetical protein